MECNIVHIRWISVKFDSYIVAIFQLKMFSYITNMSFI